MPLHLDYRPDCFEEMVGNATVLKSIQSKLKTDDHNHSILISGPSGCGKTTLARIIATEVGAFDPEKSIKENHNYQEFDTADFRGIDVVRGLNQAIRYYPTGGAPCRAWLLDECHQLTKDAQEALLKALEEIKDHVYIILATTEPNRLKDTLIRRCHHLILTPLEEENMLDFLGEICEEEEVEIPEEMLDLIIEGCEGSPGKALVTLDSIIDLDREDMEEEIKKTQNNLSVSIDLCRALIGKVPWKKIIVILKGLRNENHELIRRGVLGYCTSILLKEQNPRAFLIASSFADPFYDNPYEQLILASFECLYGED